MEIKHYFHDDRIVVEIKTDKSEEREVIKFIEEAELKAINNTLDGEKREKMLPKYEEIRTVKRFLQEEYTRIVRDKDISKDEKREPMELIEFLWECLRRENEIKKFLKEPQKDKKSEEVEEKEI
jgi:hypothetical protein